MFKKNKNNLRTEELIERIKDCLNNSEDIEVEYKKSKNSNKNQIAIYQIETPQKNLDDVILSKVTRLQLEEGMAKLRFHKIIYEDWGFQKIDKQGKAVILNFFGKPGTGKTLTAEAFAGTINKSIIKLGIAELESKFMGETSKNIQTIFKVAKENDAVLFFDEADTLLGKRLSSVTQGIDNEVNAMRSTLLIELEKFDGVAIFATNFAKNYDEAFRSRISHHIYFSLPDLEARKQLWNLMLVKDIPLADTREEIIEKIAVLSEGFSGRDIRTCMRLVLPKALLESEQNNTEQVVTFKQLGDVIEQVKQAQKEVANKSNNRNDIDSARSMLGIN